MMPNLIMNIEKNLLYTLNTYEMAYNFECFYRPEKRLCLKPYTHLTIVIWELQKLLRHDSFINFCCEVMLADFDGKAEMKATNADKCTIVSTLVMKLKTFNTREEVDTEVLMLIYEHNKNGDYDWRVVSEMGWLVIQRAATQSSML